MCEELQTISKSEYGTIAEQKCKVNAIWPPIATHIFYHKAMMYGSNLFGGWIYRDFKDKAVAPKNFSGQVKNPLEHFPPKEEAKVAEAKAELRDAYSKDFVEYVEKKVLGVAKK